MKPRLLPAAHLGSEAMSTHVVRQPRSGRRPGGKQGNPASLDTAQREWSEFRQRLRGPCLLDTEVVPALAALKHPRWANLAADILGAAAEGAIGLGQPRPCLLCRRPFTTSRAPAVIVAAELLKPRPSRRLGAGLCRDCGGHPDVQNRIAAALVGWRRSSGGLMMAAAPAGGPAVRLRVPG